MQPINRYLFLLIQFFLTIQIYSQNQIAQVETAIPAFIGYAEKGGDGWMRPQKIASLAEYQRFFGGPAWEENLQVTLIQEKGDVQVSADFSGERSRHNLYYSIQAYFANGGSPCYIVPVAGYLTGGVDLSAQLFIKGIEALDRRDEPTLIVIPEAHNLPDQNRIRECYDAALEQCARRRDRFAIIDGGADAVGNAKLSFGAAYVPNLLTGIPVSWDKRTSVVWQLPAGNRQSNMGELAGKDKNLHAQAVKALEQIFVVLPPSPLVAGVYVTTDLKQGVWKAPANVALKLVTQPVVTISQSQQEALNLDPATGKSVNAIRTFPGKGTLVWGARTLAGSDNEWRYVPVRRLAMMLEESLSKDTQWAVFEPNDEPLWAQIRSVIDNFLYELWRKGAFQGTTTKEAYFYRVGLGQTMTSQDIIDGKLIIEVGFAPLKPAEFIIVRIEHLMN